MNTRNWFNQKSIGKSLLKGKDFRLGETPPLLGRKYFATGVHQSDPRKITVATVCIVMGTNSEEDLYQVVDLQEEFLTPLSQINLVSDQVKTFDSDSIRLDFPISTYHLTMDGYLLKKLTYNRKYPNNLKPIGITTVSGLFTAGKIILPSDFQDTHTSLEIRALIAEMERYPGKPIGDRLAAVVLGVLEAKKHATSEFIIPYKKA